MTSNADTCSFDVIRWLRIPPSVSCTVVYLQGDRGSEEDGDRKVLSHADREAAAASDSGAFGMCLYEDAASGCARLVLLHGCRMAIYRVASKPTSGEPDLARLPTQRPSWDQHEDISLHDTSARNSAADVGFLDGSRSADSGSKKGGLHRTKSARPLAKLTSALRADLELLTRCMSGPAQLAEVAEHPGTAQLGRGQQPPLQDTSGTTPAAHNLSAVVHLKKIKTSPHRMSAKGHLATPNIPKPADSGEFGQPVNGINSAYLGAAAGSSIQNRRVSFAEMDEVVEGGGNAARYPPSPHPRKLSGLKSGAPLVPQRSVLKAAPVPGRLSDAAAAAAKTQVVIVSIGSAATAEFAQHSAAARKQGEAKDTGSSEVPALQEIASGTGEDSNFQLAGSQIAAVAGSAACEDSVEADANRHVAPHDDRGDVQAVAAASATAEKSSRAATQGSAALRAKLARLKAQWAAMLKAPAAAAAENTTVQTESVQGAVLTEPAARLDRARSSSSPALHRPSMSHSTQSGPVAESRVSCWMSAAAPGVKRSSRFGFARGAAATGKGGGKFRGPAGQEPCTACAGGTSTAAFGRRVHSRALQKEDCCYEEDNEWVPAADLWGPTVLVLPNLPRPECDPQKLSNSVYAAGLRQPVASQDRMLTAAAPWGSRGRLAQSNPGPVAEAVEEREEREEETLRAGTSNQLDRASLDASEHVAAPPGKTVAAKEHLTLDQRLSIGRTQAPPRPRTSELPAQAGTSTSLEMS